MPRFLITLLAASAVWASATAQETALLRLKVSVLDVPVARHALLISDDPVSAPPRRVVTLADGTAEIRLRAGKYIVESERPFVFDARTYQWAQVFHVAAGRDNAVELSTGNARVGTGAAELSSGAGEAPRAPVDRKTSLLMAWEASVFEIWTPVTHAAGFLADGRGLVATSRRAIGDATSVEVQVSRSVKVIGDVLVADQSSDVAIVRVHPSAATGIRPVPLACDMNVPKDDDRYAISVPLFGQRDVNAPEFIPATGAGGPVFASDDRVSGVSSPVDSGATRGFISARVVGADSICTAVEAARAKLDATPAPDALRLPIESTRRFPSPPAGAFRLSSYQQSTDEFDLTFLTPSLMAAAVGKEGWTGVRASDLNGLRVALAFENWSEYVTSAPPLLYVRATPRLVESFWMKVARGAAYTQGAALPPIKRLGPGFSRMRLLCGGQEVVPVHPFRIQARVTETDAIEEGFYAFDPATVAPACGTVTIVLSSVKDPGKTETRTIDRAIIERVWEDFAFTRN